MKKDITWKELFAESKSPKEIEIPFWVKVKTLSFFVKGFLVGNIFMFIIITIIK